MDRNGVWRFPEGSGRQGKIDYCKRYYCNVICGAPTTAEVKGLRRDVMNRKGASNPEFRITNTGKEVIVYLRQQSFDPPLVAHP